MIEVRQLGDCDPLQFDVTISESAGRTQHRVLMSKADHQRLGAALAGTAAAAGPVQCIEAAFRFLLDREPKESILRRFDVSVISRYFPEFEAQLPEYGAAAVKSRGER
jgi:hypothetical protein